MNYTIENGIIKLTVSSKGAEMQSIIKDGIEYLWQGDPTYWKDRAINLFPYCGRHYQETYSYDSKNYQMKIHGLARYYEFELVNKTYDSLSLAFKFNEETLTSYPFKFLFTITYKLVFNLIKVEYKVENLDDKLMYFGLGAHPGFNVPLNPELTFEDYYIEFEEKCEPKKIRYSDNGLIVDGYDDNLLVDNSKLYLKHDLFDRDIVDYVDACNKLTLKSDKDKRCVKVYYPDMKYVGFWHKQKTDAPYVCVEPWTSLPSNEAEIETMEKKKDFNTLSPNQEYTNLITIEIN